MADFETVARNLFPRLFKGTDRARQLEDIRNAGTTLVGNEQPFQADLFPGEAPIEGLSTGQPGLLKKSPRTDFIKSLLQAQSPDIASKGLALGSSALEAQLEAENKAKLLEGQNASVRDALSGLPQDNQAVMAIGKLLQNPAFADKALGGLLDQLKPTTLGKDQKRITGVGQEIGRGDINPGEKLENEIKNSVGLRKEFTRVTNVFPEVNDAYGRILASAKNPSPAGDLSLIFNYMKVLDPQSVVRESEFATAAKAGDYGDRIQSAVSKIFQGLLLSGDQRKDFVSRSGKLYKQAHKNYGARSKEFERLAKQQGVDPSNVIFQRALYTGDEVKTLFDKDKPKTTQQPIKIKDPVLKAELEALRASKQ